MLHLSKQTRKYQSTTSSCSSIILVLSSLVLLSNIIHSANSFMVKNKSFASKPIINSCSPSPFSKLSLSQRKPQIDTHNRNIHTSKRDLIMSMANNHNDEKFKVAIIGGGIAGLSCASALSKLSSSSSSSSTKSIFIEPTVFDTGRIRPGGRCSSRLPGDKAKNKNENQSRILNNFIIDHAAQILTLNHRNGEEEGGGGAVSQFGEFEKQVDIWVKCGVMKEFPKNSVVEIMKDRFVKNDNESSNGNDGHPPPKPYIRPVRFKNPKTKMYYGTNGMGSIASAIVYPPSTTTTEATNNENNSKALFKIEQDVWISPSNGVKFIGSKSNPKWKVQTNGKNYGTYDAIVIAHNGKCADRLMSKTPSKDLHSLLRVNFNPTVPKWGGKKMTLNSIYSLTIALKKDSCPLSNVLEDGVYSAFIKNEPSLRFITCQSRKYSCVNSKDVENVQVWTILSSAKFGKQHKGPQENLPLDLVEKVTELMLEGLNRSLGLEDGTIHNGLILDSRLQLWGAAVPLNIWSPNENADSGNDGIVNAINHSERGFLYDAEYNVGVCGDWLLDPSIMGAWESGRRLSNYLISDAKKSIGLPSDGGSFQVSKAASEAGIGNVR